MLSNMAYDEYNHRTPTNNTFCDTTIGCNVYGKVSGTYTLGSKSGTVTEDSNIAEYLNGEYYNSLTPTAKTQVQRHTFNIGGVLYLSGSGNDSILNNINQEKAYTWTGNIGLPNVTDILRASLNPSCTSATDVWGKSNICITNYLVEDLAINTYYWVMNGWANDSNVDSIRVWNVVYSSNSVSLSSIDTSITNRSVRPVIFLKSTTTILSGDGTKSNPYMID